MTIQARTAEAVREFVRTVAVQGAPRELSRGARGAVVGYMNREMGGDDHRKQALAWLFQAPKQYMSSKVLDNDQWYALSQWIDSWQDPDTLEWYISETFPLEAALVVTAALREQVATPYSQRDPGLGEDVEATLAAQIVAYGEGELTLISDDGETWPDPGEAQVREEDFKKKPANVRMINALRDRDIL